MNTLKELRKTLGMTQSEFAEKIAMAQQGVSMAESGARPLTDRQIVTICAVFGVDEHWLRTGEGEPFPLPSEEDNALFDILSDFAADDIDPRKKKAITEIARLVLAIPADKLDTVYQILSSLAGSFKRNEKDEG